MIRIFVDSSVLFSAIYSPKGHARDLLLMAAREELTLVISEFGIAETGCNLARYGQELIDYLGLVERYPFRVCPANQRGGG